VFHVISFECNAIAYALHLGGGGIKDIGVVLDYDSNCRILVLV
jgi:hypothetical protein